ncbi:hypothetical protein O1V64_08575 [Rouxiella badensis]|nr:hypothetical protein O1V64_08575 [Rouxiella badensis]
MHPAPGICRLGQQKKGFSFGVSLCRDQQRALGFFEKGQRAVSNHFAVDAHFFEPLPDLREIFDRRHGRLFSA